MPRPRVPWSTVACKMFALDLRTVILGFAISSAICMAVMVSLWRSQATRSTAFALLAGWATAEFCGLVLFALRGSVPDLLSIVLAQALSEPLQFPFATMLGRLGCFLGGCCPWACRTDG